MTIRASACLRSRLQAANCDACVRACPHRCLTLRAGGVSIGSGCTGCGRCHAACGSGAVSVSGFELRPRSLAANQILLTCARADSREAGLRVPCLGGLSEADVLTLCASAPEHGLILADADGCAGCGNAVAGETASRALQRRVVPLLREAGVPAAQMPRAVSLPSAAAWQAEDPLEARGRSRRGFLRALARPAAQQAPAAQKAGDGSASPARAPAPQRQRLLRALRSLAARHGGRLSPSLFHAIEVGSACAGHRVCAAVCPTGALLRYRDEAAGRAGVAFDAEQCIACRLCEDACPTHALRVRAGRGTPDAGCVPLTAAPQRECVDCGARYAAAGDELRCERCRRDVALAQAAFTTLFPQPTHSRAWSPPQEEHR